jgi:hypothetical protein
MARNQQTVTDHIRAAGQGICGNKLVPTLTWQVFRFTIWLGKVAMKVPAPCCFRRVSVVMAGLPVIFNLADFATCTGVVSGVMPMHAWQQSLPREDRQEAALDQRRTRDEVSRHQKTGLTHKNATKLQICQSLGDVPFDPIDRRNPRQVRVSLRRSLEVPRHSA